MSKQNILFIMTDEQKFDAVTALSAVEGLTPNLERLARDGIRFSNAYTPSPVCGPARAAVMSGMFPPSCGVARNWSPFCEGVSLMTDRLCEQGYQTAAVGKLHLVPAENSFGFEYKRLHDAPYSVYADDDKYSEYIRWLKEEHFAGKPDPVELFDQDELSFNTDIRRFMMGSAFRTEQQHDVSWTADEGIRFLRERDKSRPFFLKLSFFGPHMPYDPPEPYSSMFDPQSIELPESYYVDFLKNSPIFARLAAPLRQRVLSELSEESVKQIIAAYLGQVRMVDHYMGKVIDFLRETGQYDNTTIIFTSDHGDHMGSYGLFFKGHMYDSCCKVPLVIKPTGDARRGVEEAAVVNTLDLYGTILELAGDECWRTSGIESRSLLGMLFSDIFSHDNKTYSIIGGNRNEALSMLRLGRYKLCRLADGGSERAFYEMFDLEADPLEHCDIFESSDYAGVRELLKRDLDAWFRYQYARYPAEVTSIRSKQHDYKGIKNM